MTKMVTLWMKQPWTASWRVMGREKMTMSNSTLVNYTCLSPHHSGKRTHAIDTITIHCMAGNLTVESCGALFQRKEASSNYGLSL